jgi:hypothetical protein
MKRSSRREHRSTFALARGSLAGLLGALAALGCSSSSAAGSSGNDAGASGDTANDTGPFMDSTTDASGADKTPFPVAGQIYFLDGTGSNDWEIKLTSYAEACTLEHDGDSKKQNSYYINIEIEGLTDTMPPPGTYKLGANSNGLTLAVELKHDDVTCNQTAVVANSATLELTTSTSSGATGMLTASMDGMTIETPINASSCVRDDSIPFTCEP